MTNMTYHHPYHHNTQYNVGKITSHFKTRKPGSRTVTSTKKEEKMHGDDVHSGMTSTGYKVVANPKVPRSVDPGRAFQYIETFQGVLTSNLGPQQAATVNVCIGTTSQAIVGEGTSVQHFDNPTSSSVPYLQLNPNQYITGSTVYNNLEGTSLEKIFLSGCGVHLRVANFTSLPTEFEVYVLKNKTNHNKTAVQMWEACAKNHGLNEPINAAPAVGASTGETVGYYTSNVTGGNPFMFKEFNKIFQLLKAHHVNLGPSAQENIHFNIKMNMMIDAAKIIQLNNNFSNNPASWSAANITQNHMRGGIQFLIVLRGGLTRSTDAGSSTSYGAAEIGCTVVKHHYFKTVRKSSQQVDPLVIDVQVPSANAVRQVNIVDAAAAVVRL